MAVAVALLSVRFSTDSALKPLEVLLFVDVVYHVAHFLKDLAAGPAEKALALPVGTWVDVVNPDVVLVYERLAQEALLFYAQLFTVVQGV